MYIFSKHKLNHDSLVYENKHIQVNRTWGGGSIEGKIKHLLSKANLYQIKMFLQIILYKLNRKRKNYSSKSFLLQKTRMNIRDWRTERIENVKKEIIPNITILISGNLSAILYELIVTNILSLQVSY